VSSAKSFEGLCHCRAVGFNYRTALAPQGWSIRACQCGFCRTHAALSTSDPAGSLEFVEHVPGALHKYRFGHRTADFLLCKNCGTYIGATMQFEGKNFGVINIRALQSLPGQIAEGVAMDFEGEVSAERLARRASRWTPIASG
jgi:hypothetical protein